MATFHAQKLNALKSVPFSSLAISAAEQNSIKRVMIDILDTNDRINVANDALEVFQLVRDADTLLIV